MRTMDDCESGYDPKHGYNRNAVAHKTPLLALMHRTVKLTVTSIGLAGEEVHNYRAKKTRSESGLESLPAAEAATATSSLPHMPE